MADFVILENFLVYENYSDEEISNFLINNRMTKKQLLKTLFKYLNAIINMDINENNKQKAYRVIKLISIICEKLEFNEEEININKSRIKRAREELLRIANTNNDYDVLKLANKLDEVIIDKNLDANDLIKLIKELVNRYTDFNIIKKLLSLNKNSILDQENELFDFVFNKTVTAILNDDDKIFYYISLLKIVYSSKIDKIKYINILNQKFDLSNKYANELFMIIHGVKRGLTTDEILQKYSVSNDPAKQKVYIPSKGSTDEYTMTIDKKSTYLRDDAISIRKDGNKFIFGIHVSDLASKIKLNSLAFQESLNNLNCIFLQDTKPIRLFEENIEKKLSLDEGNYKSTLSLYIVTNLYGEILDYYFIPNDIYIYRNMTYQDCDNLMNEKRVSDEGRMLHDLYTITSAIEANNIDRRNYWERKSENNIDRPINSRGDIIVRNSMVLYNMLIAQKAFDCNSPFVYKIKDPQYISDLIDSLGISINDYTRNLIETIYLDSKYSPIPKKHTGLNIDIYSQTTAPLRKVPAFYNQLLFHGFVLKDTKTKFDETQHELLIKYFNQRDEEIKLMQAEYNRELKLSKKK